MDKEWPVSNIAEPRENDAILLVSYDSAPLDAGTTRLLKLLEGRREMFASLSPLQRPVVTTEIIELWRKQEPPGRFLNMDSETGLYFDIGDKKARKRISKALLTQRGSLMREENIEESDLSLKIPNGKAARRISSRLDYRREGRLYDRSTQEKELREAFHSVIDGSHADRLVLISGPAGIGKTALGSSIRGEVERCDGLFVQGKYGQTHGSNLRDALQSAFADYADQVARRDKIDIQRVREQILKTLKKEAAILVDVVPEMEKIIGPQQHVSREVGQGAMSQTRVNYVYRLLVKAIASPEQPLVVLLDDLQWAGQTSLELFVHLLSDRTSKSVLFVGTLRTEPWNPQLEDFLERVKAMGFAKHHIRLQGLDKDHVHELISDVLDLEEREIAALSEFVYTRTGGNVFFVAEFLRVIQDEDLLRFEESSSQWKFDEHMIRVSMDVTTVRDLFRTKILDLPLQTQEILKIASCLGFSFETKFLEMIFRDTDVSSCLTALVAQGLLVVDPTKDSYSFCHDSVLEAAYNLIPAKNREHFHLKIGERLSKLLGGESDDGHINVILDQIIRGKALLKDKRKMFSVANLCLQAGEKAVASSNFPLAAAYLKQGIHLCQKTASMPVVPTEPVTGKGKVSSETSRSPSCWKDEYTLCLRLYEDASEVAYCNGSFDEVTIFTNEIIRNARSFNDTLRARNMQVYSLGSAGRMDEAINEALSVLGKLGEKLPARPSKFAVVRSSKKTRRMLRAKSDEILLRLEVMTDERKIAAMQMFNLVFIYAFYLRPKLASMIAHRMIQLTVKDGITGMSGVGFAYYSMILCGSGGSIEEGNRYGKLAVRMNETLSTQAWLCRLSAAVYGLTFTWKESVENLVAPLQLAYEIGLSTGDMEYAFLNACIIIWDNQFRFKLSRLESDIRALVERLEFYGQTLYAELMKPVFQTVLNFMGQAKDPSVLIGEVINENAVLASGNPSEPVVLWTRFQSAVLAYHFDDFVAAASRSAGLNVLYDNAYGATDASDVLFYETMAMLSETRASGSRRKSVIRAARTRLKRLRNWARHSPENLLPKQLLIEAELALVTGDDPTASSKYMSAVLHARDGGFMLQEALANERLGELALANGRSETGKQYLQEALRVYSEWGSLAKVRHLETKYSFLNSS